MSLLGESAQAMTPEQQLMAMQSAETQEAGQESELPSMPSM
jgi:hypothetical protein